MFGSKLMTAFEMSGVYKNRPFCMLMYKHAAYILCGGAGVGGGGQESSRTMLSTVISQLSAGRIKLISSADVTAAVRRAGVGSRAEFQTPEPR